MYSTVNAMTVLVREVTVASYNQLQTCTTNDSILIDMQR